MTLCNNCPRLRSAVEMRGMCPGVEDCRSIARSFNQEWKPARIQDIAGGDVLVVLKAGGGVFIDSRFIRWLTQWLTWDEAEAFIRAVRPITLARLEMVWRS